jgi:tripartite-type tricarboxylate transporter receptor subunit TctC
MAEEMSQARGEVVKLVCLVALAAAAMVNAAQAQSGPNGYPERPVRIIVPFAPAGPTDIFARLIAQKLTDRLGKQFYVENQPGAGGNIGTGNAARAAADGHTFAIVSSSFMVNPGLYPKVPYDAEKDFIPATLAAYAPNVLVVNPSLPVASVMELAAHIKASPGKYSFAHAGIGTTPHLTGEMFKLAQGLDLVAVPFNGSGPAIQSTMGGHTPIAFVVLSPAVPQGREGKLRALAVLSKTRSSALPDVPTMTEAGFPGVEADTWQCVIIPSGVPKPIVDLIQREFAAIVALPEVKEKLEALGFVAVANAPDEFAGQVKAELARWKQVVAAGNIKAE